jgi:hypothetical protein
VASGPEFVRLQHLGDLDSGCPLGGRRCRRRDTFYYDTGRPEETVVIADSPYHTAVYYVDGSVALRAHRDGSRTRDDVPDPRDTGEEVACYE